MKKIFAIALAVAMVLSMASAFALNACSTNFAWPCDADVMYCGRGTVEVVPFVKVNNGCGGYDFQINECAGAVAGENVYYAIKLNVEANPDFSGNADEDKPQAAYWWDEATLTVEGVEDVVEAAASVTFADGNGIDWDADKAKSYYLVNEGETEWIDVTDKDLDLKDVVFPALVAEDAKASKVKVCAYLESYCDGTGEWYYGDYKVTVASGSLTVAKGSDSVVYTVEDDAETVTATSAAFQAEVNKLFNLAGCTLGTCLTDKNIEKNFGWDNTVESETEIKDCFNWSAEAAAIVDAECVVAIPKTGDASVLAWLF